MKKLFVTMLAVLASGAAYALPVGNPCEASLLCNGIILEGNCCQEFDLCNLTNMCSNWCDAFSFRFGFYGDYVFNRHLGLDLDNGRDDDDDSNRLGGQVEHLSMWTNAGYIALNFWNRLDIFSSLGTTKFFMDTNLKDFVVASPVPGLVGSNGRIEVETDSHFSWSVGARATLWECGCTCLGIEGQYFQCQPNITRITLDSDDSFYPFESNNDNESDRQKYWEWQVGLGLSHRINMFVPYVAVKWAGAKWNFKSDRDTFTFSGRPFDGTVVNLRPLENDKLWGFAAGVSLVDCDKAAVTVEGRWGDEKAVYVNGQIRF
jgi:major outer membrane protein